MRLTVSTPHPPRQALGSAAQPDRNDLTRTSHRLDCSPRGRLAKLRLVIAWSACFAIGCTQRDRNSHGAAERAAGRAAADEPIPAAIYKEGRGLQLAPAAAKFIGLTTAELVPQLPAPALVRTAKGDFVYVANGDWVLRTPVKVTGSDTAGYTVTDGLYEGDTIVVAGARQLWLAELHALNAGGHVH